MPAAATTSTATANRSTAITGPAPASVVSGRSLPADAVNTPSWRTMAVPSGHRGSIDRRCLPMRPRPGREQSPLGRAAMASPAHRRTSAPPRFQRMGSIGCRSVVDHGRSRAVDGQRRRTCPGVPQSFSTRRRGGLGHRLSNPSPMADAVTVATPPPMLIPEQPHERLPDLEHRCARRWMRRHGGGCLESGSGRARGRERRRSGARSCRVPARVRLRDRCGGR